MERERIFSETLIRQSRIQKAEKAIHKLGQFANCLQRGDFSQYPRFSPYKRNGNGITEQTENNLKIASKIKRTSIPILRSVIEKSERFIDENQSNLPLRVQLKHKREIRGIPMKEISRQSGIRTSYISRFESGERPPNAQIVNAYCSTLKLSDEEKDKYLDATEEEKEERRKFFIKKRVEKEKDFESEGLSFGQALRRIREAAGLSLSDLALESGLTRRGIHYIELGLTENVDETTLIKLMHAKSITLPDKMLPSWLTSPSNHGEYLRSLRVKAGIQRVDFATRCKRKRAPIFRVETGKKIPKPVTIKLYEEVLGVKITFPDFSTAAEPLKESL